jgi:hydroxymethylpyrimidine pyrophosphatase-like HAD family hydrolase
MNKLPDTLLAVDLDGTCISEDVNTTDLLRKTLESQMETGRLAYATGRHYKSACNAILDAYLPQPDYLITDVGNRVFKNDSGEFILDKDYEAFNINCWKLLDSVSAQCHFPGTVFQEGAPKRRVALWAESRKDAERAAKKSSGVQ